MNIDKKSSVQILCLARLLNLVNADAKELFVHLSIFSYCSKAQRVGKVQNILFIVHIFQINF